jgi:lipopolysaccharide/colanic/teichoic acid biosynthesis glycosyltransferase
MKRRSYFQGQNNFGICAITSLQDRAMNYTRKSRPARESFERLDKAAAARTRVPSWKRMLDIICILAGSILWVPVWLLVALFIKIVSPGPVLFKQERIGHMSKKFRCLKFRTMAVNADTGVHQKHLNQLMTSNQPMKKLDGAGDTRLIPGGLWIRSLGVDELPQLINILYGEMSLVGPRPCVAYEYERFQPHHRRRCETLPGLTGLWQVNGKNRTTFEKMMELDLAYVEKKSLFLDLRIIVSTVPAVLVQVWDIKMGRKAAAKAVPVEIAGQSLSHPVSNMVSI